MINKENTMKAHPEILVLVDNGLFPNSKLPVLHYKKVLKLPKLFAGRKVKRIFSRNNWGNNWKDGVYTFDHYHSITHEVLGVIKGSTTLQLGGEDGLKINVGKGDMLVIPAGVAHQNLGNEQQVICIGGYPEGKDFDMNFGKPGERPQTDANIAALKIPETDPLTGKNGSVPTIWKSYAK